MTNEQIVEKIRNGYSVTENMQLLYERNLPLIKRMIKPYTAYENTEDLLQESYFGLWEAVQHYETSENVLFMTYAGFWIKQSAQRYIEKCSSVVRIPSNTKQKIIRYNKTVQKLTQEQSMAPADKEVADSMQISVSKVEHLKTYSQSISSLDAPLNDDTDTTLGESIQADYSLEDIAIDKIYEEHSKSELWGIVERYTADRENHIIKEYFMHNKSMPEIAREENLTVSRIREIKEKGLRRLRRGNAKRELYEKFEIVECGIYRNSMNKFNEHNFTSAVEYIAIRKTEIKEGHVRRLQQYLGYTRQNGACL